MSIYAISDFFNFVVEKLTQCKRQIIRGDVIGKRSLFCSTEQVAGNIVQLFRRRTVTGPIWALRLPS